ncbi:MAG: hypothetical protein ACK4TL_14465 [Hyphomicrobiaceae bacterium]
MRTSNISLALLVSALLAGTAAVALGEPLDKAVPAVPAIEGPESDAPTELRLDLDLTWQIPDLSGEPFGGLGTAPAAQSGVAPATFPKPEAQSAIARAIKSGYSVATEPEHFPAELNRGYVITDRLRAGIRAGFNAPVGDEMRLTAAGAETELSLGQLGPAISWGWHVGLDMALEASGRNAIEAGPQFKVGGDRLALTINPKLAHSFGAHDESEVALAYTAGLKSEITSGVALGIEAFGATSDIATVPGTALQTHRTSSGIYVGLGLLPQPIPALNASRFSLELGALADIKEAQPDWTGKLKAAVTW